MADLGYNVHITGDTSDLEVKLRGVGAQLSKTARQTAATAQAGGKAAKAQRNEQGLLVDSMGRVIEGLSKWRQELGFYVDDTGRVLNAQGQLVDGLTTIQQKFGMYTDETGRIFNASGEFTGLLTAQGEKLKAAQERVAGDVKASWMGAFKGISDAGLMLNVVFSQLGNRSTALMAIVNAVGSGAASIHTTIGVAKALGDTVTSLSKNFGSLGELIKATGAKANTLGAEFANVGKAGATMGAGLRATLGALSGSMLPVAAIVTGVVGAVGAYIATVKQAQDVTTYTSDEFKQLEERAKAAGKEVRSLGEALAMGAMGAQRDAVTNAVESIEATQRKIDQLMKAREEAIRRAQEQGGMGAGGAGGAVIADYEKRIAQAQGELRSHWAELSKEAEGLVARATESLKTEAEKLQDERNQYQKLLDKWEAEVAKTPELATGENAKTAENLRAYMANLDKRIAEAKEKEEKGANDNARAEKLRASGLDRIFGAQEAVAVNFQNYAQRVKEWQKLAKDGTITQQELADAQRKTLEELTRDLRASTGVKEVKDAQAEYVEAVKKWGEYLKTDGADQTVYDEALEQLREQYRQRSGLSIDLSEVEKAQTEYSEKLEEIAFQLGQGIITEKEANTLRDAQLDALNATLKADKEKTLSDLGVNSIIESARRLTETEKTWKDEINDARKRLTDAVKDGAITEEAANEARKQLTAAWKTREKAEKDQADKLKKETAQRARESIRQRFGVDNLMESLKSPLQRFQETINELHANAKAFSMDELQALQVEAWQKFRDEMATTSASRYAEEREKSTAGSSLTANSDALYKALVERQAPTGYQNTMQRNTTQLVTAQREGNELAEQQNYYLAQMLATLNTGGQALAVYGG